MQILPIGDFKLATNALTYLGCMMEENILDLDAKSMDDILNDAVSCVFMTRSNFEKNSHRFIQKQDTNAVALPHAAVYAAFTQEINAQGKIQIFPKVKLRTENLTRAFTDAQAQAHLGSRVSMIMNHRTRDYPTYKLSSNASANLAGFKTVDGLWCFAEYDLGAPVNLTSVGLVTSLVSSNVGSIFHTSKKTKVQALVGEVWTDVTAEVTTIIPADNETDFPKVITAQKFRIVCLGIDIALTETSIPLFCVKFYGTYVGIAPRVIVNPKTLVLIPYHNTAFAIANVPNVGENNGIEARDYLTPMYGFHMTDVITNTTTADIFVPDLEYIPGKEYKIPHFNVIPGHIKGEGI